jgi:DNA-binding NtrC family response regulator
MTLPGSSHRARRRTPARGRRILVVDGEERMRGVLAAVLDRAGYGVVTCAGPDDALALLAADGGFALVIAEGQPGGVEDGLELPRRIAVSMPGLAVIVVANGADAVEAARTIASVAAVVARDEAPRVLLGPVRAALGA